MDKRGRLIVLLLVGPALGAACKKDKDSGDKGKVDPARAESGKTAETATQPPPAASAGGEALVKTIEGCWAAYASWDKDKFRACYAGTTEVLSVDAVPPDTARTPQDVVVMNGVFRNAFPDFAADLQLIAVNGKKAAVVALLTGTHKGRSLGMPPTNKKLALYYGEALEADDSGHWIREHAYADQATLLHQLGIQEAVNVPSKEQPWPEKVRVVARNDETEKANLAAFKASFEALAKGDPAGFSAIYADDATYRYLPQSATVQGPKEIARARDFRAVADPLEMSVRDAWAAGDWVVAETNIKGTLAQDFGGVKGTKGKTWEQTTLELLQFTGGKVKRHLVYANGLKFAVDIGLFDPSSIGM